MVVAAQDYEKQDRIINSNLPPRFRSSNPDGLDSDKYVKRICKILYSLDPLKYAFLAGMEKSEINASDTKPTLIKLGKQQPFIKPIRLSLNESNAVGNEIIPSPQIGPDQVAIVNTDVDIGEYYHGTTADYVKRSIRSSSDHEVKANCEEMIKLINVIASLEPPNCSPSNIADGNDWCSKQEIAGPELRCIELFHAWVGKSKLGLGYLFYLTKQENGWGDEFITKVVHHLAPRIQELPTEEIVTLMLMIFFKRDGWNGEDIYEVLDPTMLQKRLSDLTDSTRGVTDAELCAICLGLRRIKGFTANIDNFRDSLYRRLENIGKIFSSEKAFSLDAGHLSALNMATIQISVLLQQGYHMGTRDPAKHILRMLQCYEEAVIAYDETGVNNETSDGRFLMETRAATKIMIFGSAKGGLHNKEVTASVMERLLLGKHLRHLSLRDIVSFLKFLGQVKEHGTLRNAAGYSVSDVVKAVFDEIKEITNESDQDMFCGMNDVILIIQSWLYLSSFDQFDLANIEKVMKSVKALPEHIFEPNSSLDREEENVSLGRYLAEACYQALFPNSYSAYLLQDTSKRETLSTKDCEQFTRLISSLDRTMNIYLQGSLTKDLQLENIKIKRLIKLNQSQVPAIFYEKTRLPATLDLSRRQQLVYAVYRGLLTALDSEDYLRIVHVLPHFQEPDIIFGHIAGNKISVPLSLLEAAEYDIKPAPDIGEWTVISVDAPSSIGRDLGELASTTEFSPQHANPERHRQLRKLGYQIYPLTARDQKELIRGNRTRWAHRILANILTGNIQDDPNPRGVPATM